MKACWSAAPNFDESVPCPVAKSGRLPPPPPPARAPISLTIVARVQSVDQVTRDLGDQRNAAILTPGQDDDSGLQVVAHSVSQLGQVIA